MPMKRVLYGPDVIESLTGEVATHGASRVSLIASNTLVTQTDVVERVKRMLGGRLAGVFHNVSQHVHRNSVPAAAAQAHRAAADLLLSVGGGSPIDGARP